KCSLWSFVTSSIIWGVLLVVLMGGCSSLKKDTTTIILAHAMSVDHPVSEGMRQLAKLVDEKSGGKLQLEIYPSGQLGSERELLELLQVGSIGMAKVFAATLGSFIPAYQVYSLPYLFRSREHMEKVLWGPVGKQLLLTGIDKRLRGIVYYDAGMRSFYSKESP